MYMDRASAAERAEFGARVEELRRARGWTQEGLGERLAETALRELGRRDVRPTTRQTVFRWEQGASLPDQLNGWLLCRLFDMEPEELSLHRVVTSEVAARFARQRDAPARQLAIVGPEGAGGDDLHLDWERVGFALGSVGATSDPGIVEDQWALTRRILDDRRRLRVTSLLEVQIAHVVRLRRLRSRTRDEGMQRELAVMLATSLVGAGHNFSGRTDFGMATAAFREAADVASEVGEDWLRTTALVSLAQLGGIHARWALPPATRTALAEDARRGAAGASAEMRVWYHASRAQLSAMLGQHVEAERALELAARARGQLAAGTDCYFAAVDWRYLDIEAASVAHLAGRPRPAADQLRSLLDGVEPDHAPVRAWIAVHLAAAEVSAGDFDRAGRSVAEARELARRIGAPLLEHSVDRIVAREPWVAMVHFETA
jgi:transcriptional regulator with XRE-family HTH domain